MSNVLIAWELGGGLNHVMRACALAHEFARHGHRAFVALRDPGHSGLITWPAGTCLLQAPIPRQVQLLQNPANYSEILFCSGYHDQQVLAELVAAWGTLFEQSDPALVVSDHAPTACLVARLAEVPLARLGSGFFAPPMASPFPPFRPTPDVDTERLLAAEARVLASINGVAQACGVSYRRLADALRPDLDLLACWPELDHYAGVRPPGMAEFLGHERVQMSAANPQWPAAQKESARVLVYLQGNYGGLDAVASGLRHAGASALVYLLGGPPSPLPLSPVSHWGVQATPFDAWAALQACDALVCHGGNGLVAMALDAGRPVLMLPQTVEQYLYALRVEATGAGLRLDDTTVRADFPDRLARFLGSPDYGKAARRLVQQHRPRGDAIARSVEKMLALIRC